MFSIQPDACGNRVADSRSGWVTNNIKIILQMYVWSCPSAGEEQWLTSEGHILEHEYQTRAGDLTGAESHFRKRSHDLNVRAGLVKVWRMCSTACAGEGFKEQLRGPDYSCYQHQRRGPCADPKKKKKNHTYVTSEM